MTKKDLVEIAMKPPTVRISQAWGGHESYPIPFNYRRAIFESLENLTVGLSEILRYIQMKEEKAKHEKNRNNRDKKKKRSKFVSKG